jgi:hypothetical protein
MQSELPFYEGPEDALRTAVQALGGAKQVGPMLWPDKSVDAASRLLLDCINSSRSEKLEFTQIMRIFSLAKEAGCHGPFSWIAGEIGYEAKPITKAEEVDRLVSVIEQASKTQAAALAALERMQRSGIARAA